MKFTKRERDIIILAKKGYSYKEMAIHYGATYYAVCSITKSLYKKLEVRSMRAMLAKIKRIEDSIPVEEAAKEEWVNKDMFGSNENYQYFLKGFELAAKRYRG